MDRRQTSHVSRSGGNRRPSYDGQTVLNSSGANSLNLAPLSGGGVTSRHGDEIACPPRFEEDPRTTYRPGEQLAAGGRRSETVVACRIVCREYGPVRVDVALHASYDAGTCQQAREL